MSMCSPFYILYTILFPCEPTFLWAKEAFHFPNHDDWDTGLFQTWVYFKYFFRLSYVKSEIDVYFTDRYSEEQFWGVEEEQCGDWHARNFDNMFSRFIKKVWIMRSMASHPSSFDIILLPGKSEGFLVHK